MMILIECLFYHFDQQDSGGLSPSRTAQGISRQGYKKQNPSITMRSDTLAHRCSYLEQGSTALCRDATIQILKKD